MLNKVKAQVHKPAYQYTSCNICRQACARPVLTAKASVGQFDLCAQCAEKLGYDVQKLGKQAAEVKALENRMRAEKELAFKQNEGVSHFKD